MKAALLAFCLLCSACVPVVQHGPWVRKGYSGNVGGSGVLVGEAGESGTGPGFSFDGGMRWGFPSNDSATDGIGLGVQLPLIALLAFGYEEDGEWPIFKLLNFDGYIASKPSADLSFSFGVTASSLHAMPYVQLGKYDKWYTTQALMLLNETNSWMFAPSFTSVRRNSRSTATHVTITGGIGTGDSQVFWMAGLTIMFEFIRARN